MPLHLNNTLTRKKELFVPRDPGRVGMYLCGPTVYAEPHIGNLRNVVVFDVLRRHLQASGYEVLYVRNVTDVDDKIINAAGHEPLHSFVVADHWARVFDDIAAALGATPPDISPRATAHIPEMLELVEQLLDAGLAYQEREDGDIYFSVGKAEGYGKLSGKDLSGLRAGERVDIDQEKRDPLDFVLWKAAKPGEPFWRSPYGPGRPGWHLECSAMAAKYLGAGFDIHGGGVDLIFPHHENEIAQAEGATELPFARYWLHNAFLELSGGKMSKSVGNVLSPRDLLGRFSGPVLRYTLLGAHYRSPLDFSIDVVEESAAAYERLSTFATNAARAVAGGPVAGADAAGGGPGAGSAPAVGGGPRGACSPGEPEIDPNWEAPFVAALDDDLNVPAAIAVLFDLVAEANPLIGRVERGEADAAPPLARALTAFTALAARLGFTPLLDRPDAAVVPAVLDLVLELRERARTRKDFQAADLIRDRLAELGIRVEDRVGGGRWHLVR